MPVVKAILGPHLMSYWFLAINPSLSELNVEFELQTLPYPQAFHINKFRHLSSADDVPFSV